MSRWKCWAWLLGQFRNGTRPWLGNLTACQVSSSSCRLVRVLHQIMYWDHNWLRRTCYEQPRKYWTSLESSEYSSLLYWCLLVSSHSLEHSTNISPCPSHVHHSHSHLLCYSMSLLFGIHFPSPLFLLLPCSRPKPNLLFAVPVDLLSSSVNLPSLLLSLVQKTWRNLVLSSIFILFSSAFILIIFTWSILCL